MNDFGLGASGLGLISSLRLDGRKEIQFVKSIWSILQLEYRAPVLPPLDVINKRCKTITIYRSRNFLKFEFNPLHFCQEIHLPT